MTITWDDFEKVDMRVGTVRSVEPSLAKKPTYKFTVDFGAEIGMKISCAALTKYYAPEDRIGKQIIAVVNFPPKKMGPETSEVLILGVPGEDGDTAVVRLQPERNVEAGVRVF
jgi:tRNA-binding protein